MIDQEQPEKPQRRREITTAQLFEAWFSEMDTLITNTLVKNPNLTNGYYWPQGCASSGMKGNLMEDMKRWSGYLLEKNAELKRLTLEYLEPEPMPEKPEADPLTAMKNIATDLLAISTWWDNMPQADKNELMKKHFPKKLMEVMFGGEPTFGEVMAIHKAENPR